MSNFCVFFSRETDTSRGSQGYKNIQKSLLLAFRTENMFSMVISHFSVAFQVGNSNNAPCISEGLCRKISSNLLWWNFFEKVPTPMLFHIFIYLNYIFCGWTFFLYDQKEGTVQNVQSCTNPTLYKNKYNYLVISFPLNLSFREYHELNFSFFFYLQWNNVILKR